MIRQGAATRDGRGEAVTAIVYLLAGENGRVVVDRIKAKVEEIQKDLPEGVVIDAYYDRSDADREDDRTRWPATWPRGACWSSPCSWSCWGTCGPGLIVALAIPLSMLFAGNLMLWFGIAGSLMSLGAIDFGLIVDSAVIVIENCVSRLAHAPAGARRRRRGPPRDAGGPPAGRLRRGDHHDGPPADPGAAGGRGEDVPADGPDGDLRPDRLAAALADGHAGPGLVLPQAGDVGARHAGRSAGPSGSTSRSSSAALRHPGRGRARGRRSGSPRACRWRSGWAASSSPSSTRGT